MGAIAVSADNRGEADENKVAIENDHGLWIFSALD